VADETLELGGRKVRWPPMTSIIAEISRRRSPFLSKTFRLRRRSDKITLEHTRVAGRSAIEEENFCATGTPLLVPDNGRQCMHP